MRFKRGQIAIFVILAVFLVVALGIYFFVKSESKEIKYEIPTDISPVNDFVVDCIRSRGENAIIPIGLYGGNIDAEYSTETGIIYYFYGGEDVMPSKEIIEKNIDELVGSLLPDCINDFENFPGYEIESGDIKVSSSIETNKVILNVFYPLKITKDSKTFDLENFRDIEINARLGYLYNISKVIIQDQLNHPDSLCISCLYNYSNKYDIYISTSDIIDTEGISTIFVLADDTFKVDNESYILSFAVKYNQVDSRIIEVIE